MPSDTTKAPLEERLHRARDRFRSSLSLTLEQVRGQADEQPAGAAAPGPDEARDLGAFAARRIDAARFAALLVRQAPVSSAVGAALRQAQRALASVAHDLDALCTLRVEPGGSLHDEVARALAQLGRAFAAARRVSRLRAAPEEAADVPPPPLPFRAWTRAERELAPPLLVRLAGADLRAEGLAEFLDGGLRILLLAEGEAPPAPLARLVTPGTFVLQAGDEDALLAVLDAPAPGVAALLPEGAARFVHDPARGATLHARLSLAFLPARAPAAPLGGRSARQQADELAHLAELGAAAAAAGASGAGPGSPADTLAAWLLAQADVKDL